MAVECPREIFEVLLSVVPGETDNDQVMAFAYDHIGSIGYLGADPPELPALEASTLESWSAVESWLSSIECSGSLELEDILDPWFDYDDPGSPTPLEIFKSPDKFLAVATEKIETMLDESGDYEFGCLEVTHEDRQLMLIYECSDAWSLGHAGYVRVAESEGAANENLG